MVRFNKQLMVINFFGLGLIHVVTGFYGINAISQISLFYEINLIVSVVGFILIGFIWYFGNKQKWVPIAIQIYLIGSILLFFIECYLNPQYLLIWFNLFVFITVLGILTKYIIPFIISQVCGITLIVLIFIINRSTIPDPDKWILLVFSSVYLAIFLYKMYLLRNKQKNKSPSFSSYNIIDITPNKMKLEDAGRYCSNVDNSGNFIAVLSRDKDVIMINQLALNLISQNQEDLIGKTMDQIIKKNKGNKHFLKLLNTVNQRLDEVIRCLKGVHGIDPVIDNNRIIWISYYINPIMDKNNRLDKILISAYDISNFKNNEKCLIRNNQRIQNINHILDSVYNVIPDIIGLQDDSHTVIRYNQAGYEYLKKKPSEVNGKKCYQLIGEQLECENCPTRKTYDSHKPERTIRYYPDIDKWWDIRSYPVLDPHGKVYRVVEHIRDVTEDKKNQYQLKESQALFRGIYDNSPLGMALLSDGLIIEDINFAFSIITGYNVDELRGMSYYDLCYSTIIESDKNNFELLFQRSLNSMRYKTIWNHQSGETIILRAYVTYIDYLEYIPNYFILQIENITLRQMTEDALRESERLYRLLVENTSDLIVLLDMDGEMIYINNVMMKMFRTNIADNIGKSFYHLINPQERQSIQKTIENCIITNYQNISLETKMLDSDKNVFHILWQMNFIEGEEHSFDYILGIGVDISDKIEWQNKLEHYNQILEAKNTELKNYTYMVSHDLKEPLRMVSNYLGLIKKRLGENMDSDIQDFLHFAVDGAERMKNFINDLLDYSRMNNKQYNFTATDLKEVLTIVLHNLKIMINEENASIEIDELPIIHADSRQMVSLFQNIISNAIKYHKPGMIPIIKIHYEFDEGFHVFHVIDNGIGIPMEYHQKIFELFQRVPSQFNTPGTGVGLTQCKQIVEHHKGTLFLDSIPDVGTTFIISLPIE